MKKLPLHKTPYQLRMEQFGDECYDVPPEPKPIEPVDDGRYLNMNFPIPGKVTFYPARRYEPGICRLCALPFDDPRMTIARESGFELLESLGITTDRFHSRCWRIATKRKSTPVKAREPEYVFGEVT